MAWTSCCPVISIHSPTHLEDVNVGHRVLQDVKLALQIVELDFQDSDLVQPVPILNLALVQGALLDLDLLIQERKLVIAANELRSKDVALIDDDVVLFLLPEALLVCLVDDVIQLLDLRFLAGDRSVRLLDLLFGLVELEAKALLFLLHLRQSEKQR